MNKDKLSPFDKAFSDYLGNVITVNKKGLIAETLAERTRRLTVVLENIYKPHNASAVMRTCDCFGVQDVYMIEQEERYKLNPHVAKGAGSWVDIHRFNEEGVSNTKACYDELKAKGYKVYATSPHAKGVAIADVPVDEKIAIVFGNEHTGLSQEALDEADAYVTLPMYGFTESFNISVTAAICMHDFIERLHKSTEDWSLSSEEVEQTKYQWYRQLVGNLDKHEEEFKGNQIDN